MRSFFNLSLLLVLSITAAISSHDEEVVSTPVRATVAPRTIEPTPGEIVSKMQAEILTKKHFISVLGAEIVDSWGIDWEMLEDSTISFDNARRISAMTTLHTKLTVLARRRYDPEFSKLYSEFLTLRGRISIVHLDRLETIAERYFSSYFPDSSLESDAKAGGVQLGERIIVHQSGKPDLTFHVKTHSEGRLSSKSTAAKLVNSQELMAYKVLQHLGIGCESHFFQRSPEDVYIATLDAGTGGSFTLFEVVSGHLGRGGDDTVGHRLAGKLITIPQSQKELDRDGIEAIIAADPIAQNFVSQMVTLDIVTRIFRLHDLLNNPANFGFFESSSQAPSIRVIDFRVADDPSLKINYDHWGGFLEGNGLYRYEGSHRTMRYVLHDRPLEARIKTARDILSAGLGGSIKKAARIAHRDVMEYLSQDVFVPSHSELMPKLEAYVEAIIHNIDFFSAKLFGWKPEESAEGAGSMPSREDRK